MPLKESAEEVTNAVVDVLGTDVSPEHAAEIAKIVEAALLAAYRDCTERNTKVAAACCDQDMDQAHKIAEEMRRNTTALIANLSSLR